MSSIENALSPHAPSPHALFSAVQRIAQAMASLTATVHPTKVLVLAPFGQLLPLLQAQWTQSGGDGFAPRFETTRSWACGLLGGGAEQLDLSADDFRFDVALDNLTARSLLERASLGALQDELLPRLLQAASTLAPLAAAVQPTERMAWLADKAQALVPPSSLSAPDNGNVLRYEAAVAQIALAWVAASSYATDLLWQTRVLDAPDYLIVLNGFQRDPLAHALITQRTKQCTKPSAHWALFDAADAVPNASASAFAVYRAQDFEQEALWAASCVLHQLQARDERSVSHPVALIATDRSLTRRIRAMLDSSGVTVRDETGWTLSTSRMAASVLTALNAAAWNARSDAVLDWLKNAPAYAGLGPNPGLGSVASAHVAAMEALLRQSRCNLWRERLVPPAQTELVAFDHAVQTQLDALQAPRTWQQWQASAVAHLRACGQWDALLADTAGQALVKALHWDESAQAQLAPWPLAQRRLGLDAYTAWVRQTLEAASFVPPASASPQVVILPLPQLLTRAFFALVVPGCDEQRLSASPDPTGPWTPPERLALGLPSREQLAAAQRTAWAHAMGYDRIDVLWRHADSGGESLLPSPLLSSATPTPSTPTPLTPTPSTPQGGPVASSISPAAPTVSRSISFNPTPAPMPRGDRLPVKRLSQSAYADLRSCPYRFFATQQLGLRAHNELDAELEKRDFGDWLHEVLKDFHEGPASTAAPSPQRDWLDACAAQVTKRRQFSAAEFLPYQAGWPALRDQYLTWWSQHRGAKQGRDQGTDPSLGARFESAEVWQEVGLGTVTLIGRLDRIDSTPPPPDAGPTDPRPVLVIDYKTESPATTDKRLKDPLEDLQLAFYAALLPHDNLRAAYLNVSDRDGTVMYEPTDIVATRDTLIEGILDDMQRIAGGATLAALGEGAACDYCATRGLCRKDFWNETA